ncbi:MAG: ribosome maturation factor RimP [Clostridia bacterium]|nr:ribosome maturation factor RimP [Clostridia bacterium]
MTSTESKVEKIVKPVIEKLGYVLYDVIYEKEGKDNYLRIFIDKDGIISINDCENVNNAITDILDENDIIKNSYMLEVSSPGIEKRLRSDEHLEQNIDKKIEIHTFKNDESTNSKIILGFLKGFDNDYVKIDVTENDKLRTISINKKNISKITTVYDWEV